MTNEVVHGRVPPPTAAGKYKPMCLCGSMPSYDERWDGYYCPISNVWLETTCAEDDLLTGKTVGKMCVYCGGRPEKHEST